MRRHFYIFFPQSVFQFHFLFFNSTSLLSTICHEIYMKNIIQLTENDIKLLGKFIAVPLVCVTSSRKGGRKSEKTDGERQDEKLFRKVHKLLKSERWLDRKYSAKIYFHLNTTTVDALCLSMSSFVPPRRRVVSLMVVIFRGWRIWLVLENKFNIEQHNIIIFTRWYTYISNQIERGTGTVFYGSNDEWFRMIINFTQFEDKFHIMEMRWYTFLSLENRLTAIFMENNKKKMNERGKSKKKLVYLLWKRITFDDDIWDFVRLMKATST